MIRNFSSVVGVVIVAGLAAGCGGDTRSTAGAPSTDFAADFAAATDGETTLPPALISTTVPADPVTTTTPEAERAAQATATTRAVITNAEGPPTTILSCEAGTGSAVDVTAEPEEWRLEGQRRPRWNDSSGCPVRLDVIAHERGDGSCEAAGVQFITVTEPFGSSVTDQARSTLRYVWDPDAGVAGGPHGQTITPAGVPPTAESTGNWYYDQELGSRVGLRLDPTDTTRIFLAVGEGSSPSVQVWPLAPPEAVCQ